MSLISIYKWKEKFHRFLSFLCGNEKCLRCGERSVFLLCDPCLADFMETPKDLTKYCNKCGSFLVSEKETCLSCRDSPLLEHVDFVLPLHSYRLWKKEILFYWKILGNRSFSPVIAKMYAEVLERFFFGIALVPIPPRPGKIRKTGWDQIDEITKILSLNKKHKISNLLKRVSRRQQKKMNRQERLDTIGRVYALKDGIKDLPSKVVLIDDIMTTGATLESCALVLKEAGVKEVYALCLFIGS